VQKKLKVSVEIIWWTKARKIMPKMLWIKLTATLIFVGFSSEEGIIRERLEKTALTASGRLECS
jgi:hypothetical protein